MNNDPSLYDRFIDIYYQKAFAGETFERSLVPYEQTHLPAIRVPSAQTTRRETIVIHGVFDSFIEEFYSLAVYFSSHGYDVILFESPGQGTALKKFGLSLTYQWEKPVKAVLDHFHLDNVTLLGISMGGWLCFRAAAYEPRIHRVVSLSIAFDYMQILSLPIQLLVKFLLQSRGLMDLSCPVKNERELPGAMGDQQRDAYHKNTDADGCNGYIAPVQ